VDGRIVDAALQLYGELGWSGFSIEGVAKGANVGKASIYLRWSSKQALLADALTIGLGVVVDHDTGDVRRDLEALVVDLVALYAGPRGPAAMRAALEAPSVPAVAGPYGALTSEQTRLARTIVRRGVRRGQLPSTAPIALLLSALSGGVMAHSLAAPAQVLAGLRADASAFSRDLVELVLSGCARVS
jgi:AcrR family transcriptional regulator